MQSSQRTHWIAFVVLGVALAAPAFFTLLGDDAYIHARIARNLLDHHGFVFNDGDRFKADSSTGYVLVIAGLASITGSLETAIRTIAALSIVAVVSGLGFLAATSKALPARALIAALSPIPFVLVAAYEGMETPLACALIAASAIAWRHGRARTYVLFAALAACVRFEAILLFAMCMAQRLAVDRRDWRDWRLWIAATPLAALFAFELWQFGSIVPHAAHAKVLAYDLPLLRSVRNGLELELGLPGLAVGLVLVATFGAALATIAARRRVGVAQVFVAFAAAVFAAWMLGRTLVFSWYYCLLAVPFAIGVLLDEPPANDEPRAARLFPTLATVALVGLLALGVPLAWNSASSSSPAQRVDRYKEIGAALYAACPQCTLVTSEVGGLGFAFQGRVYDAFGVTDPAALRFHPMRVPYERPIYEIGAIPPDYIRERQPDFIVTMPHFSHALRASPVLREYRAYSCPFPPAVGRIWGDDRVYVFARSDVATTGLAAIGCDHAR